MKLITLGSERVKTRKHEGTTFSRDRSRKRRTLCNADLYQKPLINQSFPGQVSPTQTVPHNSNEPVHQISQERRQDVIRGKQIDYGEKQHVEQQQRPLIPVEEDRVKRPAVVVVEDGLVGRRVGHLHVEDPLQQEFVLHEVIEASQRVVDERRQEPVDSRVRLDALFDGDGESAAASTTWGNADYSGRGFSSITCLSKYPPYPGLGSGWPQGRVSTWIYLSPITPPG